MLSLSFKIFVLAEFELAANAHLIVTHCNTLSLKTQSRLIVN